ncbi:tetratricopeptide repeat protein [Alloacidobacterium dinghuense]|uniref:Tetratricopeptide repeat protein n=1 Tax=Alloacidobacterium dinghuense TaxID=2763107 RepID=A0A7G8BK91_9BACT|nr:tetratricopeptide repeat protein [Alloacidobacterium dinghuense]QNI32961.1 tetratricopeptide repeat protein [Alloacidobacterium dinghuense]
MTKRFHRDKVQRRISVLILCAITSSPLFALQQQHTLDTSDTLQSVHHLLDTAQFAQAESALRAYLEKNPSSADGHFLLGYALFREKRPKDSLAEFTEGSKFEHPQASDLKIVAADYVVLGDFTDADKWLTVVTEEAPGDADAWYLLGRTKYNENRFEEAIQAFQRVLTLRPNDIKAEDNLGLSYQGLNRLDEAKKSFESAILWQKDFPMKDAQPYLNMGILLMDQDQAAQAQPYLQQAVDLAPHNPKVREQLGRVYDLLKMPDKAEQQLEQAVALAPDVSALHFKLGQIYRRQGKQQLAQQQFDICAKLNSAHSSTETPNPAEQN